MQLEIAQQFQRIDPRFHLARLVAEESGARPVTRQKFPRANWPRQFEIAMVAILLSAECGRNTQV